MILHSTFNRTEQFSTLPSPFHCSSNTKVKTSVRERERKREKIEDSVFLNAFISDPKGIKWIHASTHKHSRLCDITWTMGVAKRERENTQSKPCKEWGWMRGRVGNIRDPIFQIIQLTYTPFLSFALPKIWLPLSSSFVGQSKWHNRTQAGQWIEQFWR